MDFFRVGVPLWLRQRATKLSVSHLVMGMITRQILPSIIHCLHPQRYFEHHLSCPRMEPLFRPATAQALAGVIVLGPIEINILPATGLPTRPCLYYHLWCSSLAHFAEHLLFRVASYTPWGWLDGRVYVATCGYSSW
ncbi:hypothetical protein BKA56DRAFT_593710 [Ilyonectria sp. MPI-CAGE-AT-0026]|nr:hypothetical protein BKA56DRAFT_593710 [Ilyonectria sp. MPI-CAGE-AT-0026]